MNARYTLQGTLRGHRGAILCVRVTDDGKIASGGMDGVKLYTLPSMKSLERPTGAGHRGATTVLTWIRREDEPNDALVYGTQNGFLVCWRQSYNKRLPFEEIQCTQLAEAAEITGLVFDSETNRLAVCGRNSTVQLFSTDEMMTIRSIFSVSISNYLPIGIAFGNSGNETREILTFGMHDGQVHTLRGSDGRVEHTLAVGGMIGDAAVNWRKGVFCIDDPSQGVGLYRLDSGARIRTFPVPVRKSMRPRQVSFAEDCSIIVSGSDHGLVYIFDRRSGQVIDSLSIGNNEWLQTLVAADVEGIPTILAAKSRDIDGENEIFVWKKMSVKPLGHVVEAREHSWNYLRSGLQVLMFMASVAFIWDNIGASVKQLIAAQFESLLKRFVIV